MLKKKNKLISVVMPVRNAGSFLVPAIESILGQTYKNFEFIIVDDASSDNTSEILKKYRKQDKRIVILVNKKQKGIVKSVTMATSKAKGEFVARMDADDISSPDRFKKQVDFLIKNKDVVAVGGQCQLINSAGLSIGEKKFPLLNSQIKSMIFASVPMQQPSMMVAKNRLPNGFIWYDEKYTSAEELELIFKLFQVGKVANLSDYILKYRIHSNNTSLVNPKGTFYLTLRTRLLAVKKFGYKPTIKGVLLTATQTVFVLLFPDSWIRKAYSLYRGVNLSGVKINIDDQLTPKKSYELVKA